MTDRYANGTTDNDTGGIAGGKSVNGFDPADSGYYHGGDFRGLTGDCTGPRGLARIKNLGFTSIRVTPPFGQRWVQGSSAAYHGYWIRDFEHVDAHLGTDADFAAFVDCAHRIGLKVILDVVVNHTADYVLLPSSSTYSDAPFRDCRGKKFDPAAYVRRDLPVPERGPDAEDPDALRHRPCGEVTVVVERRDELPRPRRHLLRLVHRAVPRAGRLLWPRRPLHGEAGRLAGASRTSTPAGCGSTRSTASASTRRGT